METPLTETQKAVLAALQNVRRRLRDMECNQRKSADLWHNLGAVETAAAKAAAANMLDSAVDVVVLFEAKTIAGIE
jgi:hypothetical protein